MKCFIKNVPPIDFSIKGNSGLNFPIASTCGDLQQALVLLEDIDCWLVKEEDGYTNIYTDRNNLIGVDCRDPIEAPCFIILEEEAVAAGDSEILGAELYEESYFFCDNLPEPDILFIGLQEDVDVSILFDPYETKFRSE